MHARTARAWLVAGLAHLLLALVAALVTAGGAGMDARVHVALLASAAGQLAAACALGLAPAYLRKDWPAPLVTHAALLLAALGDLAFTITRDVQALAALHGVALVLAALQPLALLVGPRWEAPSILGRGQPYRAGDGAAGVALGASLVGLAAGGALLAALPRGLPHAGALVLLLGAALPAALGALLFALPREAREPAKGATLVAGASVLLLLAGGGAALGLVRPIGVDLRPAALLVVTALALVAVGAWRNRPQQATGLQLAALVLAVLGALVVPLAVLTGVPNNLAPLALYACAAFALALLGAALVAVAPIALPGRARGERAAKWAGVAAIAGLFLLAPAFQYPRPAFPGVALLSLAGVLLVVALAPLAVSRAAPPPKTPRARR